MVILQMMKKPTEKNGKDWHSAPKNYRAGKEWK